LNHYHGSPLDTQTQNLQFTSLYDMGGDPHARPGVNMPFPRVLHRMPRIVAVQLGFPTKKLVLFSMLHNAAEARFLPTEGNAERRFGNMSQPAHLNMTSLTNTRLPLCAETVEFGSVPVKSKCRMSFNLRTAAVTV
jgi:hypothetical protein